MFKNFVKIILKLKKCKAVPLTGRGSPYGYETSRLRSYDSVLPDQRCSTPQGAVIAEYDVKKHSRVTDTNGRNSAPVSLLHYESHDVTRY
jgi:hypothetical protein